MTHDPALEAHEHAEHAEHASHAHDGFISKVSITIAVLAVLAQDKATDAWGEYQADSLKKHVYGIAAQGGGPHAADFQATAKEQVAKQAQVRKQAQEDEAERDAMMAQSRAHEHRHHWLTAAATLLEIAIAICTVAIVTRRRAFWLGSLALGAGGVLVTALAYLA